MNGLQGMSALHLGAHGGRKKTARAMHTDLAGEEQFQQQQQQQPYGGPADPWQGRGQGQGQGQEQRQEADYRQQDAINGASENNVNPDQIPSLPASRDANQELFKRLAYPTMERISPPMASSDYLAVDQNMSSPKFARLTTCNVPITADLLHATCLPLGMVIQPLAATRPEEMAVPVVYFGESGPPRCRRCRAYINPFMGFAEGGMKFVCNMCMFGSDVNQSYFAPLGPQGRRVDVESRPELLYGTVEFVVSKEYWSKPPQPMRLLFMIDVSNDAVNRGVPKAACESIRHTLYGEREGALVPEASIAIVTFDKDIHFYNLSPSLDESQMLVVSDLEDVFVPMSSGLFVDPQASSHVVDKLLSSIHGLFEGVKVPEAATGSALQTALVALEGSGGKVALFTSSLPSIGLGRLPMREDSKIYNTDREKVLYKAENLHYKRLAEKYVEAGIGLDLFLFPGAYIDVATVGSVSSVSGGETFLYPNFVYERDVARLMKEVCHGCVRETGFAGVMKVRCSNGLQTQHYYGNFLQKNSAADLEFGSIDADKAVTVTFTHDGVLDEKLDAHFQSALLYTTASGQRRVRVQNMVAAVTRNVRETFRVADQDAIVTVLAKEAASKIADKPLKDIRSEIVERTVQIFGSYRNRCVGSVPPQRLILPEALRELAILTLAMIKTRAFRGGQHMVSDIRVHAIRMLKSMGVSEMTWYLYPRMLPLHSMDEQEGFADEQGMLRLPPSLRLSYSQIQDGGAYLVDNSQLCLLWLPTTVSPNLLKDLFGDDKDSLDKLDPLMSSLPVLETTLNAQVRNIVSYLEQVRSSKRVSIQLARQGMDGAEYEFAGSLVEDRNNDATSYVDHLCVLHRHIQTYSGTQRSKASDTFSGLRPMMNY